MAGSRWQRSSRTKGWVYVAECQGIYKIGYTARDPRARVADFHTGNPFPVKLIGAIPGTQQLERDLHRKYQHRHVKLEWFALAEDEIQEILKVETDPIARLEQIVSRWTPAQQRKFFSEVTCQ